MNGFHSITIFVIFAYIFIKFKSYLLLILQSEGMKCTSVTNTPDASNWIEEKWRQKNCVWIVRKTMAVNFFPRRAPNVYTQKSTCANRILCFYFFFVVFACVPSRLVPRRTGTTNGINARDAHTAFRNLNAIICVRDDDGWRAFYWNFYAGCWFGIMRRYLYLHTKHLTHTQNMQKWRRLQEQMKRKKSPPLSSSPIPWRVWSFDSAICTTEMAPKWKSYFLRMRIISVNTQCNYTAFGEWKRLFIYWFSSYFRPFATRFTNSPCIFIARRRKQKRWKCQ